MVRGSYIEHAISDFRYHEKGGDSLRSSNAEGAQATTGYARNKNYVLFFHRAVKKKIAKMKLWISSFVIAFEGFT